MAQAGALSAPGSVRDEAAHRQQVEDALLAALPSAEAQQEALQAALPLTQAALDDQRSADAAPAQAESPGAAAAAERRRWWLAARLRLLQHLERVGTVLALHSG